MNRMMVAKAFLLVSMAAGLVLADDKPASSCGDLLAQLQKKPKYLEFISCEKETQGVGKPLTAKYRVAGVHAAQVERYLIQNVNLPRRRKSCCQWDGEPGRYKQGDKWYHVWMVGEDTADGFTYKRADWGRIPYFYIEVEVLTEDP